jgi:hypothetical protein
MRVAVTTTKINLQVNRRRSNNLSIGYYNMHVMKDLGPALAQARLRACASCCGLGSNHLCALLLLHCDREEQAQASTPPV